jgi:hypothetical protein
VIGSVEQHFPGSIEKAEGKKRADNLKAVEK